MFLEYSKREWLDLFAESKHTPMKSRATQPTMTGDRWQYRALQKLEPIILGPLTKTGFAVYRFSPGCRSHPARTMNIRKTLFTACRFSEGNQTRSSFSPNFHFLCFYFFFGQRCSVSDRSLFKILIIKCKLLSANY